MTAAEAQKHTEKIAEEGKRVGVTGDPNFSSIMISGKYKAAVIADKLSLDKATFSKLNPYFDKQISTGVSYYLTLPVEKIQSFHQNKNAILEASIQAMMKI
jgi:hypothetical protein